MKILKICIVFSVALASARLAAADLTVASGSPYDVTASETYSNVYASDKVAISPSVTLTASSYALQADAAADAGCVDAVSIGQGASFVVNSLGNANSATGRIVFAGANAKISKSSNTWGSTWFGSGRWELAGDAGADINLAVQGSWSGGNFNGSGVGVRLTGDGNVKISAGWTNNRSQGLMNFNSGFAFANSGTVTLTSEYWGTYVVNSDGVFAPSVAGVHLQRGSYKSNCVTLWIAAGKVAAIKTLEAYDGARSPRTDTVLDLTKINALFSRTALEA